MPARRSRASVVVARPTRGDFRDDDLRSLRRGAGPLPACSKPERQFRKIIGYKHLAALALAVEADVAAARAATSPPPALPTDPTTTTEPAATLADAH